MVVLKQVMTENQNGEKTVWRTEFKFINLGFQNQVSFCHCNLPHSKIQKQTSMVPNLLKPWLHRKPILNTDFNSQTGIT